MKLKVLITGLSFLFGLCSVFGAEAYLLNGKTVKGIVQYNKGQLKIHGKSVDLKQVFELRFEASATGSQGSIQRVTLKDGNVLAGSLKPGLGPQKLVLQLDKEQKLEFSFSDLDEIDFGGLKKGAIASLDRPKQYVILNSGKVIEGSLRFLTFIDAVFLTKAGDLKLKKSALCRYIQNQRTYPSQKLGEVLIKGARGERIRGKLLYIDGQSLAIQSSWGEIKMKTDQLLSIEFNSDKVKRIQGSEFKIEKVPFLNFIREPRVDESLFGQKIGSGKSVYQNGVSVHSRTSLTADIPQAAQSFFVDIGIDQHLSTVGDALYEIKKDGKSVYRMRLQANQGVRSIQVDVSGGQKIELIFDYSKGGSSGDHGFWADPRFSLK